MSNAVIYQPTKNAMQSGTGNTKKWLLKFESDHSEDFIEPLMGWEGSSNTQKQVRLSFPSQEAAVSYAESKNIPYQVVLPKTPKRVIKSYADNFK